MATQFPIDTFQHYEGNVKDLLSDAPFFADLAVSEIELLVKYANAYDIQKDQTVLAEGSSQGYMCLIISGAVDILKNSGTGHETITRLGAGKTLGEMSIIDGLPFSATAIAVEDTILVLFSQLSFYQLAETHPELGLKLYTHLSEVMSFRLRQTTDMLTASLLCIGDLTVALDRALDANKHKTQFVAEISHELRTPLNAILGYSELLEETAISLGHEEYVDDAHRIHLAGQSLLGLINNLLDLTKAEAGKTELNLVNFSMFELINKNVLTTLAPMLKKYNNQFTWVCPNNLMLYSDPTKIQQILLNLLSNACKFSENKTINLIISTEEDEHLEKWIVLQVIDTGIGMTDEQIQQIFQPYEQANAKISQDYGGTGLGLSIVNAFAQLLKGEITVNSKLNQGTTFTLRIPFLEQESL